MCVNAQGTRTCIQSGKWNNLTVQPVLLAVTTCSHTTPRDAQNLYSAIKTGDGNTNSVKIYLSSHELVHQICQFRNSS